LTPLEKLPSVGGAGRCGYPATYNNFVTAYVYVSLKKSVLDPQGKTIQGALKKMGYQGLESVRQGKYFEITLDGGLSREQAQAEVERMAREVLTNPVIEEFRFSISE
jgi:phosphoribosylformylglycinamidine synthase PurS subunit